jgi:protein-tyrosine kinase
MKSTDNQITQLGKDADAEGHGSLVHRAVSAAAALNSTQHTPAAVIDPQVAQRLARNRVITALHDPAILDAYRVMKSRLLAAVRPEGHTLIGITSPVGSEGKSLTAVNLATILAMDPECSVLLVDCDLRTPKLHSILGLPGDPGLTDYLARPTNSAPLQSQTEINRLSLLPAGKSMPNSSELLGSRRMNQLIHSLKSEKPGRFLIFDLPSTLGSPDVLALLPAMQAVILVVEESRSVADDIRKAGDVLAGANLIGTVLNKSMNATA